VARTDFLFSIFFPFLVAFLCLLVSPLLFPSWPLTYFAPPLVIVLYRRPLLTTLWYGILAGLVIDLLGGGKLGFHSTCYLLTLLAITPLKDVFFADRLTTVPLLSVFFGAISTLIGFFLLKIVSQGFSLHTGWILTDLIFMPLIDGLYAFLLFTLPGFLPRWPKREYFSKGRRR
jgi:cell shape-determining protein MreD